jgi:hypothetical protein
MTVTVPKELSRFKSRDRSSSDSSIQLRKNHIATKGLPAVQEGERAKDRHFRARRAERFEENPKEHATFRKKRNVIDKNILARGGKPKKMGVNRQRRNKKMYPDFFMSMLSTATQRFVQLNGQKRVA